MTVVELKTQQQKMQTTTFTHSSSHSWSYLRSAHMRKLNHNLIRRQFPDVNLPVYVLSRITGRLAPIHDYSHKLRWSKTNTQTTKVAASFFDGESDKKDESVVESNGGGGIWDRLWLVCLFSSWTLFNIYFNIYNKQVTI